MMNTPDHLNDIASPVLRYHVPLARRGEHLSELLRTCERVGAREVSLFSSGYIGDAVFLDPAAFARRIDHLAFCADRIRQAGLTFSLNVMHTLGHLYVPQAEIDRFGFQRQLQADGGAGTHPVLDPVCPRLRGHLAEAYRQ